MSGHNECRARGWCNCMNWYPPLFAVTNEKKPECRHGSPEGECPSCAACAACRGECGTCPYVAAPPAQPDGEASA